MPYLMPYQPQPCQVNTISHPQQCPFTMPRHHQISSSFVALPPIPTNPAPKLSMNKRSLPNFNMSNSELFKSLCQANLLAPRPATVATPPYPCWYNPSHACQYHSNTLGRSIEDCLGFKDAVWRLLDAKAIEVSEARKEEDHVGSGGA